MVLKINGMTGEKSRLNRTQKERTRERERLVQKVVCSQYSIYMKCFDDMCYFFYSTACTFFFFIHLFKQARYSSIQQMISVVAAVPLPCLFITYLHGSWCMLRLCFCFCFTLSLNIKIGVLNDREKKNITQTAIRCVCSALSIYVYSV